MSKAIVIDQPGGPEVMQWREVPIPEPGEGEVLLRQVAVGLNYIDTYHRRGMYGMNDFPATIGVEGSGIIEKLGPGCEMFEVGQRVCYAGGPPGAYAQYRIIPERHILQIPDTISKQLVAGIMVKGLTAHYLVKRTFFVDDRTTMLVHAAAGGVGLLLCQWGRLLGARVIGTVGSEEKAELAKANGCEHVVNYNTDNFVDYVMDVTDGRGCNVVYDSVGKATFAPSLDCLMPFGLMVSYGEASGPVDPLDISELQKRGSLFLTKTSLEDYIQDHAEYIVAASTVLQLVSEGNLKVNVKQSYYLCDVVRAHRDLEARKTIGATILLTDEPDHA